MGVKNSQLTFEQEQTKKTLRRRIRQVGKKARQLLKDDVRCRNCDKYLVFRVYQKFLFQTNGALVLSLSDLARLPSPETIIRVRAKIQNDEGVLLPTEPSVRRQRRISEQAYREWAQTNF